jgi:hypothetical protein
MGGKKLFSLQMSGGTLSQDMIDMTGSVEAILLPVVVW